jgi:hypothetical protein
VNRLDREFQIFHGCGTFGSNRILPRNPVGKIIISEVSLKDGEMGSQNQLVKSLSLSKD